MMHSIGYYSGYYSPSMSHTRKSYSFFFHLMSHSGIRIETLPESHHFHIWLVYIPAEGHWLSTIQNSYMAL